MFKKIIPLTIVMLMGFMVSPLSAGAAEEKEVKPKTIEDCDRKFPGFLGQDYYKGETSQTAPFASAKQDYDAQREKFKDASNPSAVAFRVTFEKARNAYHGYMQCIFDGAAGQVLSNSVKEFRNAESIGAIVSANTPTWPDLNTPAISCVEEPDLETMMASTSLRSLMGPVLFNYNHYSTYLQDLMREYDSTLTMPAGSSDLRRTLDQHDQLWNFVKNEIEDSVVAADSAFTMLSEMRQAYVIHVHLQCMLKNLAQYRDLFEKIRSLVSAWPNLIENASIHK